MSGVENLISLGDDDSPVSNGSSSPLSPDCSAILDLPMSLDFDPMSFKFTEKIENEPDIIDLPSVFNPNPDLVLIDACLDANPNTSSSTCSSLEPPEVLREQLEDDAEVTRVNGDDEYDSDSSKRNRVIGKKKTLSTSSESSSVSEKRIITASKVEEKYTMNGDSKNLVNGKHDSSTDEEEEGDDDVIVEDEKIRCPISVNKLRTQYVQHANQDSLLSPSKEVISTGIDLNSLKTSFTQVAQEERPISPNSREVISTGVDIKSLKYSITSPKDDESLWIKEADTIDINISVQSLKTSFSKTSEEVETYVSSPVEEVKPSVDRAQVTRKFSQVLKSVWKF